MYEIADKIIELRLALRRACMCEDSSANKSTMSLKTKILYLIAGGASSKDILAALGIAKTNLALITSAMAKEGLITKTHKIGDKREIAYAPTKDGLAYLKERTDRINAAFKGLWKTDEEYEDAKQKLEDALTILSFVGY